MSTATNSTVVPAERQREPGPSNPGVDGTDRPGLLGPRWRGDDNNGCGRTVGLIGPRFAREFFAEPRSAEAKKFIASELLV